MAACDPRRECQDLLERVEKSTISDYVVLKWNDVAPTLRGIADLHRRLDAMQADLDKLKALFAEQKR